MSKTLDCPVDFVTVNEYQARITAAQVIVIAALWVFTGYWIIAAFLSVDFILRVANLGKYSVLNIISGWVIKKFSLPNKPTDRAPKRFAAFVGVLFAAAILVFIIVGLHTVAIVTALILIVFAFLESAFGFCAGCYVYTYVVKPLLRK
jgi:hypothetical protein